MEGASRADNLAEVDFRNMADPEQIEEAHAVAARLAKTMRTRLTRRDLARRRGYRLDLRRTIHGNISHGGVPISLVKRQRKEKPLRLVVLLDASGSMSMYTGVFLRFIHGVLDEFREAEAFLFHTRLAYVSDAMKEKDAARALDRLSIMAQGAGGGTKIGESLQTFNRWHAARVLHSRTCVMIVSDGYETGDAALLGREMAALAKTLPPHRLAQSDDGMAGLCACRRRHQGRVAACRSLCARQHAEEPDRARTLSGEALKETPMTRHVEVMDLVARLKAAEEAFVLATVVRTVSVTAAKAGAKAIIRPDGTIVAGWIGGGCARGAVLKAARDALADGEPRMVSVQPENLLAELGVKPGENRDGVRFAENMCPSKGTMDIFVEPVLPHPSLVILGVSPVALSLAAQARQLGYHVTRRGAGWRPLGAARRRYADRRLSRSVRSTRPRRFIVVSTQGKGDEAALRAAVATEAAYHAFVGSRRKMAALREKLIARGHRRFSARPRQGAGRPRSRRHHARGNRDVDPGRDHGGAEARTARGQSGSRAALARSALCPS